MKEALRHPSLKVFLSILWPAIIRMSDDFDADYGDWVGSHQCRSRMFVRWRAMTQLGAVLRDVIALRPTYHVGVKTQFFQWKVIRGI